MYAVGKGRWVVRSRRWAVCAGRGGRRGPTSQGRGRKRECPGRGLVADAAHRPGGKIVVRALRRGAAAPPRTGGEARSGGDPAGSLRLPCGVLGGQSARSRVRRLVWTSFGARGLRRLAGRQSAGARGDRCVRI